MWQVSQGLISVSHFLAQYTAHTPTAAKKNQSKFQVTARGARQDPSDRDYPSCLQLLPACSLCFLLLQTEQDYAVESWWQWRLSERVKPAAGCPCFQAVQLLRAERKCPPVFFCAMQLFHPAAQFLGYRQPTWGRKIRLLCLLSTSIRIHYTF